jgi:hypothetical protein
VWLLRLCKSNDLKPVKIVPSHHFRMQFFHHHKSLLMDHAPSELISVARIETDSPTNGQQCLGSELKSYSLRGLSYEGLRQKPQWWCCLTGTGALEDNRPSLAEPFLEYWVRLDLVPGERGLKVFVPRLSLARYHLAQS